LILAPILYIGGCFCVHVTTEKYCEKGHKGPNKYLEIVFASLQEGKFAFSLSHLKMSLAEGEVRVGRVSRDWMQTRDESDQEDEEEEEGPLVPPGTVQKAHISPPQDKFFIIFF